MSFDTAFTQALARGFSGRPGGLDLDGSDHFKVWLKPTSKKVAKAGRTIGLSRGASTMHNALYARSSALIRLILLVCLVRSVSAAETPWGEPAWIKLGLAPRTDHAVAYDSYRHRAVLFGGRQGDYFNYNDTYEWDGVRWQLRITGNAPLPRAYHAMAYDAARHRVVLFGGVASAWGQSQVFNDTWEYDGVNWNECKPVNAPSARYLFTMAYDPLRRQVVLFSGAASTGSGGALGDTWAWDGTNWRQLATSSAPSARIQHAMVFDESRGVLLLFGGNGANGKHLNDTWAWDGTSWRQRTPLHSPLPCASHSLAYDRRRRRVVMFGGMGDGTGLVKDTWEWDGADWKAVSSVVKPSLRTGGAMIYDEELGQVMLFGGANDVNHVLMDAWTWNGVTWSPPPPASTSPNRTNHAMAFDSQRGRLVLFSGSSPLGTFNDTWEWDGKTWASCLPTTSPTARTEHAMAYDSNRCRVVLFGGNTTTGRSNDTWEWDGKNWTRCTPAVSPAPREGHAMAYDTVRKRVLLFGGSGDNGLLDDLWEWDGKSWTRRDTSVRPHSRDGHQLAFDSKRGRLILFGGGCYTTDYQLLNDTWAWDGTAWSELAVTTSPQARSGHMMAYDAGRDRVVMTGGTCYTGGYYIHMQDIWEWDGTTWAERPATVFPQDFPRQALAYDTIRQRVVLFGRNTGAPWTGLYDYPASTWLWDGRDWTLVKKQDFTLQWPGWRYHPAMACDPVPGRVVMFDYHEVNNASSVPETWAWDGALWQQCSPKHTPQARMRGAMAYDSDRKRVVLFGGLRADDEANLNDTWEWDGADWIPMATPTAPPARYGHRLAYDAARKRIVLFGGAFSPGHYIDDTWEWDGTRWRQVSTGTAPSSRAYYSMDYDPLRKETILFGGFTLQSNSISTQACSNETWTWNGSRWKKIATLPQQTPAGRERAAMAFDTTRGRMLLYGGRTDAETLSDTWEWDGAGWARRTTLYPPGKLYGHTLVSDPVRKRLVLFGGSGEASWYGAFPFVWEWPYPTVATLQYGLTVPAGGYGYYHVKLSAPPTTSTVFRISRLEGDPDIDADPVSQEVTMTPTNWNSWQTLLIRSAHPPKTGNGHALLRVDGPGIPLYDFPVDEYEPENGVRAWSQYR